LLDSTVLRKPKHVEVRGSCRTREISPGMSIPMVGYEFLPLKVALQLKTRTENEFLKPHHRN
jgi:hypothetical protein